MTDLPLLLHGTLDEQLTRCNLEIERCTAYLQNQANTDPRSRELAGLGWRDWIITREDVLAEMRNQ